MQEDGWDMERTMDDNYWKEQFAREHERLIAALGEIADGGNRRAHGTCWGNQRARSLWAAMRRHRPGRVAFPS